MTQLFMDGFDHYGTDTDNMLDGAWAQIDPQFQLSAPPVVGARTGDLCLKGPDNGVGRRSLGVSLDNVLVSVGYLASSLPLASDRNAPIQFRTAGNGVIASVTIRADGGIQLRAGEPNGTVLGETAGPVLGAGAWHHLECEIVRHVSDGTFELRVDEVVVLNLTGLALGANPIAIYAIQDRVGGVDWYVDDLILRDTTGTYNNTFQGDLRVATLQPLANGANQGWATRSVQKLGLGVMSFLDSTNFNKGIAYDDNAALEIGAGDFAVRTFARWNSLPSGTQFEQLMGKWREDDDTRSWRLIRKGPDDGSMLTLQTCNLGTVGDVLDVFEFPFVPPTRRWYHIEVSRVSGTLRVFIDGNQVGVDTAESRTYFDGAAQVMINGQQGAGANSILTDTGMDGWVDGTEIIIGTGGHTANFTPPTVDLVAGANTALMLNYEDLANTDGSANAFVGTLVNTSVVIFPDDDTAYQTIDGLTPDDKNFIEASLVAAEGTLTLTANPLDTETLTLGQTTYTFQTSLVDTADNVLIGATASDSLDNLRAAINLEAGIGALYGTGTVQNNEALLSDLPGDQALATARTPGTGANTEPTTTTITGGSWSAATLLGGLDIPTNSEFDLSALPPETTGIKAVALVGRNFKLDSGSSELQMSLVTLVGGVANGDARPLTLSPAYQEDTIEEDPNTSGALTPTTIIGSRIRFDRTL